VVSDCDGALDDSFEVVGNAHAVQDIGEIYVEQHLLQYLDYAKGALGSGDFGPVIVIKIILLIVELLYVSLTF